MNKKFILMMITLIFLLGGLALLIFPANDPSETLKKNIIGVALVVCSYLVPKWIVYSEKK